MAPKLLKGGPSQYIGLLQKASNGETLKTRKNLRKANLIYSRACL